MPKTRAVHPKCFKCVCFARKSSECSRSSFKVLQKCQMFLKYFQSFPKVTNLSQSGFKVFLKWQGSSKVLPKCFQSISKVHRMAQSTSRVLSKYFQSTPSPPRCYQSISEVLSKYFQSTPSVSKYFQSSFKVHRMFQSISKVLSKYFKSTVGRQKCYQSSSKVLPKYFRSTSEVFLEPPLCIEIRGVTIENQATHGFAPEVVRGPRACTEKRFRETGHEKMQLKCITDVQFFTEVFSDVFVEQKYLENGEFASKVLQR